MNTFSLKALPRLYIPQDTQTYLLLPVPGLDLDWGLPGACLLSSSSSAANTEKTDQGGGLLFARRVREKEKKFEKRLGGGLWGFIS